MWEENTCKSHILQRDSSSLYKNAQNSTVKKQTIQLKMSKRFEHTFHHRAYRDGDTKDETISCNTDLQGGHNHHSGQVGARKAIGMFPPSGNLAGGQCIVISPGKRCSPLLLL